jgi:hypothetical protein
VTDVLTGPAGRVTALVLDVSIMSAHYFAARLRRRDPLP